MAQWMNRKIRKLDATVDVRHLSFIHKSVKVIENVRVFLFCIILLLLVVQLLDCDASYYRYEQSWQF